MGTGLNGRVKALVVFNNEIYAGGEFTSPSRVAKWNGASWEQVGAGFSDGIVNALVVHNGQLYAGGTFTQSGANSVKRLAVLTGGTWQEVNGGLTNGAINAFLSDAAGLYFVGNFGVLAPTNISRVGLYNGSTFSQVGNQPAAGSVNAIAKYNSEIYIGGLHTSFPNGVSRLAGSTWTALSGGLNNEVLTLATFNGRLYIGGRFNSPGQYFASYLSGSIGTAVYSLNNHLLSLMATPLKLFGGGSFTTSPSNGSSIPYFFSANISGSPLFSEGSSLNGAIYAMAYQNGKVIVGGDFTANGATNMNRVAISANTIDVMEVAPVVISKNFYPNPARNFSNLSVETKEPLKNPVLLIADSRYRIVEVPVNIIQNGNHTEFRISVSSLASGQYFYTVIDELGQNLFGDRFIVE